MATKSFDSGNIEFLLIFREVLPLAAYNIVRQPCVLELSIRSGKEGKEEKDTKERETKQLIVRLNHV